LRAASVPRSSAQRSRLPPLLPRLLGGLNNGLQNPRIQDLLGSQAKKISVATDKGLDPNMASQPLSPAQPQDGMRPMAMGDPGLGLNQDMQAAFGGQQPELYKKYGSY
jgi:hypothetical protein